MIVAWEGRLLNNSSTRFSRWEYQNIALAAVAQSAVLVHSLATKGSAPEPELRACINPLLVLNPGSTAEIYPRISELGLGLRTLQAIFSSDKVRENGAVIRYTLGILMLRNRLHANPAMQNTIRQRLQAVSPLPEIHSVESAENEAAHSRQEQIFQQLAAIYQDTISTLSYRIQVQGNVEHLKDDNIAKRIRTLLLAGIRSSVLWYQLGGRRWRLVFYRKRIQTTAGNIRRKLIASV